MMRILMCLLDLVNSFAISSGSAFVSLATMLEKISYLLLKRCSCSYES